jgi:Kelch motif
MKNNRRRKSLAVGLLMIAVATIPCSELAWALSGAWTTKTPMPTVRYGLGVGVLSGGVYAVGGYNGTTFLNTAEAYSPNTNTWSTKTPMSTPRFVPGAGVVNGILYAVGGVNSAATLATNEAFASPFFATFSASVKLAVASSSFNLNGSFALGATRSIDPRTQDVTVQVGGYSVTIPAGSFHRDEKGNFVFMGRSMACR